jgi:RNA polymerase sigma-70 factor (ECF subfamily)
MFFEGDVVGVIDVRTNGVADGSTKIVALRLVTGTERLRALNRVLGRAAVTRLLARIQQRALPSITVSGDFPVDVHA